MPALLDGGRRHLRDECAGVFDVGQIADDVDVVAAGDGQFGLDQDAAGAVERHAERLGQRRGGDSRGPGESGTS